MRATTCLVVAAAASLAVLDAQAPAPRTIAIKIGTIAPETSAYGKALHAMGSAWKARTNSRVTYTLAAGTAGAEETMLRNLRGRARSLHAAQLSAISLGHLDAAFNVFGMPMFFESYEEADRALAALAPLFEERLRRQNLETLYFAYAGWVHVFSTKPVKTVADLKGLKLYTSSGDDAMARWYRDNGFTPKQLDAMQMLEQLETGGIEALPAPPIFAQILNWFRSAPYMMEIGLAPLLGATVIASDTWNRISPADQAIVMEEARKAGERLRRDIPQREREAIEVMKKRKLQVTSVDPAEWRRTSDQLASEMLRANLVPRDVYDIARRERDAARRAR